MARSVSWRKTISDAANWHQTEARNSMIYLLREVGPTGFLLKEESEQKTQKVFLGDPHTCTCQTFVKERDLCKHITWILVKKFRLAPTNPLSWQLGLVENEINAVLQGIHSVRSPRATTAVAARTNTVDDVSKANGSGEIVQREINEEDICSICQDEFMASAKRQPVTFCRHGCGNNVHIHCMKVWMEHQRTSPTDQNVRCPLCRETFGTREQLQKEFRNAGLEDESLKPAEHLGTTCRQCLAGPIVGRCYRCLVCSDFYLCQACWDTRYHSNHPFSYRQRASHRWRNVSHDGQSMTDQSSRAESMMSTTEEKDSLVLIPAAVVKNFPLSRVKPSSRLLLPGQQCRVCLRPFRLNQYIRRLPLCGHKFHQDCIEQWLLTSNNCPADGQVVWSPFTEQHRTLRSTAASVSTTARRTAGTSADGLVLEIPGIGIARVSSGPAAVGSNKGVRGKLLKASSVQDMSHDHANLHTALVTSGFLPASTEEKPPSHHQSPIAKIRSQRQARKAEYLVSGMKNSRSHQEIRESSSPTTTTCTTDATLSERLASLVLVGQLGSETCDTGSRATARLAHARGNIVKGRSLVSRARSSSLDRRQLRLDLS